MDEEKSKQKQQDGLVGKVGDKLKKGSKDMAKQAMKKIFKKIIMAIVTVILKVLLPMIIIAILIASFWNWIEGLTSKSSDDANAFSVDYSSDVTDETNPNRIVVDSNTVSENGAYSLNYEFEFKDEEGNPYTEEQIIEKIKEDLLEKNNDLDLTQFSNSELKIIGTLMYNGLMVEQFNEEKLKAIVIFVKVDIATQSFDLRSSGEIGQEVSLETLSDSDEVYGTIEAHRTKVKRDNDGNVTGYEEVTLEYIPYGDSETQGTFCYMVNQKDEEVINKFSIDEEGSLVVAKWSKTTTENQYLDEAGNELSDKDMEKIPEENLREEINETYITKSQPIEYKQYITKYTTPYGLLSDLLIVTDNVEFCKELAQQALNSKIVINVKEELTTTTTDTTSNYTQTTLLYDYVKYEVSGQKENTTSEWVQILSGNGAPSESDVLRDTYGWNSTLYYEVEPGGDYSAYKVYVWTHEDVKYKLRNLNAITSSSWILFRMSQDTTYEDLPTENNSNNTVGDLINLDNKHITEEYEEYTIDEDYTADETFKYTIKSHTYSERNTYDFEISEVDGLYLKYKKQYNPPESETTPSGNSSNNNGQYPEESTQILKTNDSTQINDDEHVTRFITAREEKYKQDHSGAENVKCDVTELTVKTKAKTDSTESYSSTTTAYKFGEEVADTTEVTFKNVELNGQPTFTATDKNGEDEIGFLYIYDKYRKQGVDLYLENDAEDQLFSLLEKKSTTQNLSEVMKYLLYVYDGIDRGVRELKITIIDIAGMKGIKGNSTENYIKAWENGALWLYETGQSTVFPTGYLTDDGLNYIVFEDGSAGHNNIAYGWATFISDSNNGNTYHSTYGTGYYNWETEFAAVGIDVRTLKEGAPVDKKSTDEVFQNEILPYFEDAVDQYLQNHLPEYEFSQAQKDALISIHYQYGNINGFADAFKSSLNDEGVIDAENLRLNYSRFNYSGTVNDRKYANWLLFTQETYIDRSGNEIKALGGDILNIAKTIHDYMSDPEHLYYYCLIGKSDYEYVHRNNGLSCGLAQTFEESQKPGNYGYRLTCCATYVSWVLQEAGYIEEHYDSTNLEDALLGKYQDEWIPVDSYDDLEPGDIVFMDTNGGNNGERSHVQIYVGDNCWYNTGGNSSIHAVEPEYDNARDKFVSAYRKK